MPEPPEPTAARARVLRWVLAMAACLLVALGLLWWQGLLPGSDGEAEDPPRLATPRRIGDFTLDRSDPARAYARDVERQLTAQVEGSEVTVATYAAPAGQVVVVGTVFPAGSDQWDSLGADAGDALRDYLLEAGLENLRAADAGALGGTLVCGHGRDEGSLHCGWAERSGVLVTLRFATGELATASVREGAGITRTVVDGLLTPG